MKYVLTGCIGALLGFVLLPPQSTRPKSQPPPVIEVTSPAPGVEAAKARKPPDESMQVEQLVEILCQWVLQDGFYPAKIGSLHLLEALE